MLDNVESQQVEYLVEAWQRLDRWQQYRLLFRVEIMTRGKLVKAVLWGLFGVVIVSAASVTIFGVTRIQALAFIALATFVGIAIGYILGVRNS